jgi:hypothetical protein
MAICKGELLQRMDFSAMNGTFLPLNCTLFQYFRQKRQISVATGLAS